MNTAFRIAVIVAACFLLPVTGCRHKSKPLPPQQAQAPVPPPAMMVHYPALPSIPPPVLRRVELASAPEAPPPSRPHRSSHRKPSPAKAGTSTETASAQEKPQTEIAAAGTPDASPIGQLTAGGDATNIQQRHNIERLINNTENGLDKIGRSLNADEQKTAVQIRTFLTKAKQALTDNDLDGANTLATKAKVLLDELRKK